MTGMMTLNNDCILLQPSIMAASSRADGMRWKKPMIDIEQNGRVMTAYEMIREVSVLIRLTLLNSRNSGTIITSIGTIWVARNARRVNRFPLKLKRLKAYPAKMERKTANEAETTATSRLFLKKTGKSVCCQTAI